MILQVLQNPAFWASLSGLMASLGWEVSDRFIDHLTGAIGGIAGILGLVFGALRGRRQNNDKPQP